MLDIINNGLVTAYSKKSIAGKDRITGLPIIDAAPLAVINGQSQIEIDLALATAVSNFYTKYKSKLLITQTVTTKQELIQSTLTKNDDTLSVITYRKEQLIAMGANCTLLLNVVNGVLTNPTLIGLASLASLYQTIIDYSIPTDITSMDAATVQMQQNYPKDSEICTESDIATVNLISSHLASLETLLVDNAAIVIDYSTRELLTQIENDVIQAIAIQLQSESGDPIDPSTLLIYKDLVNILGSYDISLSPLLKTYGVDFYTASLTDAVIGSSVRTLYGVNNCIYWSALTYLRRCETLMEYCKYRDVPNTDLDILTSTIDLLTDYLVLCTDTLASKAIGILEESYSTSYTEAISNLDSIRTLSCSVNFSFAEGILIQTSTIPDTQDPALVSSSLAFKYLGSNYLQKLKFASGVFTFYDDLYTLSKDWTLLTGLYTVNAAYLPPIATASIESYVQEWTSGNQALFESDSEYLNRKGYKQVVWQIEHNILSDEKAIRELLNYQGYCDGSGNSLATYQTIRSGMQKLLTWTGAVGQGFGPSPALGNLPTGYILTKTSDIVRQDLEFGASIPQLLRLASILQKTQIEMSNLGIHLDDSTNILWNNYCTCLQDIVTIATKVDCGIWLDSTDEASFLQLLTTFNTVYSELKLALSTNYSFNLDLGEVIPYIGTIQEGIRLEDGVS